jgi:hypothetical protein
MTADFLRLHWALLVAALLMLVVALVVGATLLRRSAWGQLRQRLSVYRRSQKRHRAAQAVARRAADTVGRLERRAHDVKPRVLEEARGALHDARALEKIAGDQAMIAANHVRRVIHDEYPPAKHDRLRKRYLPGDDRTDRPFTF